MKCKFIKSNGETCKSLSLKDEKFCYWHSKSIPEKVKQENRSNGGKQKVIKVNGEFPEIELNSIGDILKLNSLMINKVLKNDIDVRLCTGIGYLLNLQIKCIELNNIEKKIDNLEKITVHIKLPEALQSN
jgi:hypothetical protein